MASRGFLALALCLALFWAAMYLNRDGRHSAEEERPIPLDPSDHQEVEGPAPQLAGARLERAPVEQHLFGGTVRVGDENESVAFLGDGTITVDCWEAGGEHALTVRQGRFQEMLHDGGRLGVRHVRLQGREASVAAHSSLAPGSDNVVLCRWQHPLLVHVRDRESGAELAQVSVARTERRALDLTELGTTDLGPREGDEVLLAGVESPLTLEISAGAPHEEYWFSREGYAPFRFRVPTGLLPDSIDIRLTREASLHVQVEGDLDAALSLALHALSGTPRRAAGDPLLTREVARFVALTGLPPGSYALALMEAVRSEALDFVHVELEAGQVESVTLTARAIAVGQVTFEIVGRADGSSHPRARVLPASSGASRGRVLTAQADEERSTLVWGPIDLAPGSYVLDVPDTGQTFRFVVAEGADQRWHVPLLPTETFFISFVDSYTGESVQVRWLNWSAPMQFSGATDEDSRNCLQTVTGASGPIPIQAPRRPLWVEAITVGHGVVSRRIDLSDGVDPVVLLEPAACVEITAGHIDQPLDLAWLARIRAEAEAGPVPINWSELTTQGQAVVGRVFFDGAGPVEIRFPPLDSYGELPSPKLVLDPRSPCRVVLADALRGRF